jgi:DNA-3-methyladenine glycosylase
MQNQASNMARPVPHPFSPRFFLPSARRVAPALLGHWLIRKTPHGICGGPIVETEAYLVDDPACHSYAGQTARNRVMWGPPGLAYVYFIYGNHYCVNAVCRPEGVAEAVLIRAIEPALGLAILRANRPVQHMHELTNGPGKLCAALAIDRTLDGVNLCDAQSPLVIAENPDRAVCLQTTGPVLTTQRIGITKAAELPLRFCLAGSPFVSRRMKGA